MSAQGIKHEYSLEGTSVFCNTLSNRTLKKTLHYSTSTPHLPNRTHSSLHEKSIKCPIQDPHSSRLSLTFTLANIPLGILKNPPTPSETPRSPNNVIQSTSHKKKCLFLPQTAQPAQRTIIKLQQSTRTTILPKGSTDVCCERRIHWQSRPNGGDASWSPPGTSNACVAEFEPRIVGLVLAKADLPRVVSGWHSFGGGT